MQGTASQPNPKFNTANNSRPTLVIVLALLLFALSGLLLGFATGAFVRSRPTTQQNTSNNNSTGKTSPVNKTTVTPDKTTVVQATATPNILTVGLGCPGVTKYTFEETHGSSYSFEAQTTDKSLTCTNSGGGKPLNIGGITCRLWLTKDNNFKDDIPADRVKSVSTLQQPFPKEKNEDITFSSSTPQVQPCSTKGPTTWNYQLSSSISKGTYYLIVLNDWQGILYNWTARQITVS